MHEIEYSDGQVINLEFDEAKHWYKVDGEYVPSVTGILRATVAKPALIYWAVNCGAKFVEEYFGEVSSADSKLWISEEDVKDLKSGIKSAHSKVSADAIKVGTDAHKYAEDAVSWKLGNSTEVPEMPTDPQTLNSVEAFRNWVKDNEVKWLSSEEKIYNRKLKFAGTVDAVAEVNEEFCVIDWKTGSGIYEEMYLQCAAYAKCVELIYGEEVEKAYILRFDKKTGGFEAQASSEIEENFRAFLGFLEGYRRLKDLENKGSK